MIHLDDGVSAISVRMKSSNSTLAKAKSSWQLQRYEANGLAALQYHNVWERRLDGRFKEFESRLFVVRWLIKLHTFFVRIFIRLWRIYDLILYY